MIQPSISKLPELLLLVLLFKYFNVYWRPVFLFRNHSFCFINIPNNIFFSFFTCSMHKNPLQNAGNGIKMTLFFKIFPGGMHLNPLEVLAPSMRVGQIHVHLAPPPKKTISMPVRLCLCGWLESNCFMWVILPKYGCHPLNAGEVDP